MSTIEVNEEWQAAIQAIENGGHVYITGAAGTGKSTLLRHIRQSIGSNYVVLAPTGVAALNVNGQTIHSFFKFPPRHISLHSIRGNRTETFEKLKMIIIDEVSMVRADLMDAMDVFLQKSRDNDSPFGGVQMVMFGDLYQLPPIVNSDELWVYLIDQYGGPFFFQAQSIKRAQPSRITLVKNYRQRDELFLRLLWKVRTGQITNADIAALNQRAASIPESDESHVHLTSKKDAARQRNKKFLDGIKSEPFTYKADIRGTFAESVYPTDPLLVLKVGAKIMMLKNDKDGRWVNGTVGKIAHLDDDNISVDIEGQIHSVEKDSWEQIRYGCHEGRITQEVMGSFEQYPICLAWAMTIHKSQGHTLQRVCIDLGKRAFAHGQTYVALSRCTSLEGIVLKRPITMNDIIVEPTIVAYEDGASGGEPHKLSLNENTMLAATPKGAGVERA